MAETIYILIESNVVEQTDLVAPTTIWACIGSSEDYSQTGIKIAGPFPARFAEQMITGLKSLLERLGHELVVETTADD